MVALCDHQTEWEENAAETIEGLNEIFGNTACAIQHIGSTAIHNIKAKPIINQELRYSAMIHLQTNRLIIRDPQKTDFADWHRLMSDAKTMYYLDDIMTHSKEESRLNLDEAISDISNKNRGKYFFAIEIAETGKFVGTIGYTVLHDTPIGKIVHAGYFILPEYNNNGYTTEALNELLRFAFEDNNVYRFQTGCFAENKPSERVMQKCSLIREGYAKECEWHDGCLKDRVSYRLLKNEWETRNEFHLQNQIPSNALQIYPIDVTTRELVTAFIKKEWHSTDMLIRGEIIDMRQIDGFVLMDSCKNAIKGLVTYIVRGGYCEIVSLNSIVPNSGIGTALLKNVKQMATALGCSTLQLLTTNDNLNAIGFYQKRGFELVGVNLGAIDKEREATPEIPLTGQNGILMHHELEFAMTLE